MKSLNRKGFTLIESIITFAILTIAGMMFIALFSNVSTLMKEGSFIKTESDEMYNTLISSTNYELDGISTNDADITFPVEGSETDKTQSFTMKTIEKIVNGNTVRLKQLVVKDSKIKWLPGESENTPSEGESEKPDDNLNNTSANFRFVRTTDGNFPSSYTDLKNNNWYFVDGQITVDNALSSNCPSNLYNLDGLVNQYIVNGPSNNQLQSFVQQIGYRDYFQNPSYKVFYFAVDNSYSIPTVYGIIYPSSFNKLIFRLGWNNDNKCIIPINESKIKEEYHYLIREQVKIDNVYYTKSDIVDCKFLNDKKNIYFAYD